MARFSRFEIACGKGEREQSENFVEWGETRPHRWK